MLSNQSFAEGCVLSFSHIFIQTHTHLSCLSLLLRLGLLLSLLGLWRSILEWWVLCKIAIKSHRASGFSLSANSNNSASDYETTEAQSVIVSPQVAAGELSVA